MALSTRKAWEGEEREENRALEETSSGRLGLW